VRVTEGGRFRTEFEPLEGIAGVIDFEVDCDAHSTLDMIARILVAAATGSASAAWTASSCRRL